MISVSAWPTKRWASRLPDAVGHKKGVLDGFAVHGADFYYSVPNHTIRTILNELAQSATPSGRLRSWRPVGRSGRRKPDRRGRARHWSRSRRAAPLVIEPPATMPARSASPMHCASPWAWPAMARRRCPRAKGSASPAEFAGTQDLDLDGLRRPCRGRGRRAIKVKKFTVASDVGTAVNPDGIRDK